MSAPPASSAHLLRTRALIAASLGIATAVIAVGADAVIMPDGYVVRGEWFKEKETLMEFGKGIPVTKADGFDAMRDGPRVVVFSTHAQRGGKLEHNVPKPVFTAYKTTMGQRFYHKLLPGKLEKVPDFNEKWWRKLLFTVENAPQTVEQKITVLDPSMMLIDSPSHLFVQLYHTAEWSPVEIRKLLGNHPDLKDPPGKPDPARRLAIATFLKDVGIIDSDGAGLWFTAARTELDKLKKDAPPPWDMTASERFEKLKEEIDTAESRRVIDEFEVVVSAGRYEFARRFLTTFNPKLTDAGDVQRLAKLKARVELELAQFDLTIRLLRQLVERADGSDRFTALAAACGGTAVTTAPAAKVAPDLAVLLAGGRMILSELHPDTADRLDLFRSQAEQADRRRREGKDPGDRSEDLLALALTGWAKGKNGAEKNVPAAIKIWSARSMAIEYLRLDVGNLRHDLLNRYLKTTKPLGAEELSQLIPLLPPPFAADLTQPLGAKVAVKLGTVEVPGIVKRNTGPLPIAPKGKDYYLRLPAEYHHGRSYPVLIALTTNGVPAEELVARLSGHADRHGYILLAPVWMNALAAKQEYDFSGNDHPSVTAPLRDLMRLFQVETDRVFLFGVGEGADFALDMGMARPDLFAGVGGFGPNPPKHIFTDYWRNAQKLPMFFVTGDMSGGLDNLRNLYKKWMPAGFPALLTVYQGRGVEWYRMELPRLFDWMGRKQRVRGAGGLRLNKGKVEPWQVLRETDNRFYWVGVGEGGLPKQNLIAGKGQKGNINPSSFRADLLPGNVIKLDDIKGVRKFVVWLDRDLIDWTKPLKIHFTNGPAVGWKPRVMTPDLYLMFEELYRTGDRKMLFLGKVELDGPG